MRLNHLLMAVIAGFLALIPIKASAEMMYCNHTKNTIEAAFGSHEPTGWISEGWWRIDPEKCARVSDKPLTQRFYFYYAVSLEPVTAGKPRLTWTGKYQLCTMTKAFRIEGDGECESRNYHTLGFQEIDIGATARDYTLDFKEGS